MSNRKCTPVKPKSEFTCTLYLADLGIAIKMQGKTGHKSHYWSDNRLGLTFNPSYPQQAAYHGSQNVVVFHEAGRAHHLTSLRTGCWASGGSLHLTCDGFNELHFEEPACDWFSFDLDKIDEALQLPRPKMTGFNWAYNEYNHKSSLYVDYRYQENQSSVNSLGANYIKPNKLDIMLEEIEA